LAEIGPVLGYKMIEFIGLNSSNRNYSCFYREFFNTILSMLSVMNAETSLSELGRRLRNARLERNETMEVFAERIGVSIPTLRQMELGAPTVQIGFWATALWALNHLDDLKEILKPSTSLFSLAQIERDRSKGVRQRASRSRWIRNVANPSYPESNIATRKR
jgi:transcriptional regulator with XRE-family HTH domain